MMTSYYRDDLTGLPEMGVVGRRLWEMSGLTPADMSTAFLYDHFTPFVLMQLEELGFCGRGEAKDWATVERLSLGGELPINTSGGLLGEAYIHGMNGITEVVRQIRGTSCNQVAERRPRDSSPPARACRPAASSSRGRTEAPDKNCHATPEPRCNTRPRDAGPVITRRRR